jgi:hypothetical protein
LTRGDVGGGPHAPFQRGVVGFDDLFEEVRRAGGDGICGLDADLSGHLTIRPGLEPWATTCTLSNIRVQGRDYELREGCLIPQE